MADPQIEIDDPEHQLQSTAVTESRPARAGLMALAFAFLGIFLVLPLVIVFQQAFAKGAGAYLTLAFVPSWSEGVVAGRGWIAVALVIFAGYRPWTAVMAALLFGLITSLGFVGQARNWPIAAPVLSMLPYLGTIALMIVPVLAWQKVRRLMAAPAALGEPYFRDVR